MRVLEKEGGGFENALMKPKGARRGFRAEAPVYVFIVENVGDRGTVTKRKSFDSTEHKYRTEVES